MTTQFLEQISGPFGALVILIVGVAIIFKMYGSKDSQLISLLKSETEECNKRYATLLQMYDRLNEALREMTAKVAKLEAKVEKEG